MAPRLALTFTRPPGSGGPCKQLCLPTTIDPCFRREPRPLSESSWIKSNDVEWHDLQIPGQSSTSSLVMAEEDIPLLAASDIAPTGPDHCAERNHQRSKNRNTSGANERLVYASWDLYQGVQHSPTTQPCGPLDFQ